MKNNKNKKKQIINRLDALCRQIVLIRDDYKCQKCGKHVEGKAAHTSHVIPKSHGFNLRFDLNNLKILCFHHHINWWHKNPVESGEWFKNKFPERWEYLEQNKNKIIKRTLDDYKELEIYLRNKLNEIREEQ